MHHNKNRVREIHPETSSKKCRKRPEVLRIIDKKNARKIVFTPSLNRIPEELDYENDDSFSVTESTPDIQIMNIEEFKNAEALLTGTDEYMLLKDVSKEINEFVPESKLLNNEKNNNNVQEINESNNDKHLIEQDTPNNTSNNDLSNVCNIKSCSTVNNRRTIASQTILNMYQNNFMCAELTTDYLSRINPGVPNLQECIYCHASVLTNETIVINKSCQTSNVAIKSDNSVNLASDSSEPTLPPNVISYQEYISQLTNPGAIDYFASDLEGSENAFNYAQLIARLNACDNKMCSLRPNFPLNTIKEKIPLFKIDNDRNKHIYSESFGTIEIIDGQKSVNKKKQLVHPVFNLPPDICNLQAPTHSTRSIQPFLKYPVDISSNKSEGKDNLSIGSISTGLISDQISLDLIEKESCSANLLSKQDLTSDDEIKPRLDPIQITKDNDTAKLKTQNQTTEDSSNKPTCSKFGKTKASINETTYNYLTTWDTTYACSKALSLSEITAESLTTLYRKAKRNCSPSRIAVLQEYCCLPIQEQQILQVELPQSKVNNKGLPSAKLDASKEDLIKQSESIQRSTIFRIPDKEGNRRNDYLIQQLICSPYESDDNSSCDSDYRNIKKPEKIINRAFYIRNIFVSLANTEEEKKYWREAILRNLETILTKGPDFDDDD